MKNLILTILMVTLGNFCFAGGDHSGGGDYQCEVRIKDVVIDIKDWINRGGHKNLELPAGLTTNQYSEKMLAQIDKVEVGCVGEGDPGFPVLVDGVPKTCRFDLSTTESKITCDWKKFNNTDEARQYPLIHHELAGLAQIEVPDGSKSNYDISNQLIGFLVDKTVKKLEIFPASKLNCKLYLQDGYPNELNPFTDEYGDIDESQKTAIMQDSLRKKGFILVDSLEKSSLTLEYSHTWDNECRRHSCTFYNFNSLIKIKEAAAEINNVNFMGRSERKYMGIKEASLKESLLNALNQIGDCRQVIQKIENLHQ